MRALIASVVAALALAGCASAPKPPQARLAPALELALPLPPGYPQSRTLLQTVHARYDERDAVFEAVLQLSPETAEIVVTAGGGPRLATITWSADGVRKADALIAPDGVPVENLLADIFISLWPIEAVRAALPESALLHVEADGARIIRQGADIVVEIRPSPDGAVTVINHAFGYELTVRTQVLA